jgi:hypothetical protein
MSDSGICECNPGWGDSDCSKYVLKPDSKCLRSSGPNPQDCIWCVAHARKDRHLRCVCESNYSGSSCEHYIGACHSRCRKCNGPEEDNCTECVTNATLSSAGRCVCQQGRTGEACQIDSKYSGACDPICNYCIGPSDLECVNCVENADKDSDGRCTCYKFWSGDDCTVDMRYGGKCDPKCNGCTGPFNSDCVKCTAHAYFDYFGNCSCETHWNGTDCSINMISRG